MSGRGLGRGLFLAAGRTPTVTSDADETKTTTATHLSSTKSESKQDSDKKDSGLGTGSAGRGVVLESGGSSGRGSASVGRGLLLAARGRGILEGRGDGNVTLATTHSSDKERDIVQAMPTLSVGRGFGRGLGVAIRKIQTMDLGAPAVPEPPKSGKSGSQKAKSTSSEHASVSTTRFDMECEPVMKHGKDGEPVEICTNFIRLESKPDTGIYEYEVRFEPQVESLRFRYEYLNQHRDVIGEVRTFDGVVLYLPKLLKDSIFFLTCVSSVDQSETKMKLSFKRKKRIQDCMHFYNLLFEKIFKILKYQRIGTKMYDPTTSKIIPQHKLEVWPGYVKVIYLR